MLKNLIRPYFGDNDRLKSLASLETVDYVYVIMKLHR